MAVSGHAAADYAVQAASRTFQSDRCPASC